MAPEGEAGLLLVIEGALVEALGRVTALAAAEVPVRLVAEDLMTLVARAPDGAEVGGLLALLARVTLAAGDLQLKRGSIPEVTVLDRMVLQLLS